MKPTRKGFIKLGIRAAILKFLEKRAHLWYTKEEILKGIGVTPKDKLERQLTGVYLQGLVSKLELRQAILEGKTYYRYRT